MKRKDIILIVSILVVGILGTLATRVMNGDNNNKIAVITADNKEVSRIPVDPAKGEQTFSFKFGENTGYLDVRNGAVKMEEMDLKVCPKKVCSDTGWISKPYQTIVCLPNKITVSFENKGTDKKSSNTIDDAAY
ncbi:MAG: NusG domain II-containing protein [Caulobacteraceae bacterium]